MRVMSIIGIVLFGLVFLGLADDPTSPDYIETLQGGCGLAGLYGLALCIVYLVQNKRKKASSNPAQYAELREMHNLFKEGVIDELEYESRKSNLLGR